MTGPFGDQPLSVVYLPGYSNTPWKVVGVGDFDGNGVQDIVWQNPNTRQILIWYMSGTQTNVFFAYSLPNLAPLGWTAVGVRDFDGNGKPDIFFQNDIGRQLLVFLMMGTDGSTVGPAVGLEFNPPSYYRFIVR